MLTLLTATEFLRDFFAHCQKAKRRIWVQAMIVEDGDVLQEFANIVETVSKQVEVRLQYDWISTRSLHGETPLLPIRDRAKRMEFMAMQERTDNVLERLETAGVHIKMLNVPWILPSLIPIAGRNHTKIYIVDDIAWIGGCNFFDDSIAAHDVMIRCEQSEYVEKLSSHYHAVNDKRPKGDSVHILPHGDALFTDCGRRGNSIIYQQAKRIVEEAKDSVIFASQFTPTGQLLDMLVHKARQGMRVELYTSYPTHPHFTQMPHTLPHSVYTFKVRGVADWRLYHTDKHLHAKIIMADDKVVMIGSHNYVDTGVLLGTEEIALQTQRKEIVEGAHTFIQALPKVQ